MVNFISGLQDQGIGYTIRAYHLRSLFSNRLIAGKIRRIIVK